MSPDPPGSNGADTGEGSGTGPDPDPDSDADPGLVVAERQTPEGLLVAVCDGDVLGETFEEGPVSLTVTEEFYGGDPADEATVRESLSRAAVANVVGSRAVRLAIDAGYVDPDNVMAVDGTHHAQFVSL